MLFRSADFKPGRPTPMRPVDDRIHQQSPHFVIMEACTTAGNWSRRGKRLALIEKASSSNPTRIDKRLKAIRQIIAVREVINMNHAKACHIYNRYMRELMDLQQKCERLYPCHFIIKGVSYQPAAAIAD